MGRRVCGEWAGDACMGCALQKLHVCTCGHVNVHRGVWWGGAWVWCGGCDGEEHGCGGVEQGCGVEGVVGRSMGVVGRSSNQDVEKKVKHYLMITRATPP